MARTTGTFTFPSNFEVTKAAPLDARASTPLKSELTDGSLPFPYLGMLVAVTEDSTSNTGLYLLSAADATNANSWIKVDSSGGGGSGNGTVSGTGTANTIPMWANGYDLTDSKLAQTTKGIILSGGLNTEYIALSTDTGTFNLSANSNGFIVGGNSTIQGNLSVLGDLVYIDTTVSVTSALSVVNHGTGPAIYAKQTGTDQPIAKFVDAEGGTVTIGDGGAVAADTLSATGNIVGKRYLSAGNDFSQLFSNCQGTITTGGALLSSDATTIGVDSGALQYLNQSACLGIDCEGTITGVTANNTLTADVVSNVIRVGVDGACVTKWDSAASGDITGVTTSSLLSGGGTSGSVEVGIDSGALTYLDQSACPGLLKIGTVTSLSAGDGLLDNGTATDPNIAVDSTVVRTTGTQTIGGNKSFTDPVCINGGTASTDALLITNDYDSSSAGPIVTLKRNSDTPDDGDYLGQIKFKGENDADQEVLYAKVTGKISDVTDGTEDGLIETAVKKDGANVIVARQTHEALKLINGTGLEVDGNILSAGSDLHDIFQTIGSDARGKVLSDGIGIQDFTYEGLSAQSVAVSQSILSGGTSHAQGTLTLSGAGGAGYNTTVDLGLQRGDSPTFNGLSALSIAGDSVITTTLSSSGSVSGEAAKFTSLSSTGNIATTGNIVSAGVNIDQLFGSGGGGGSVDRIVAGNNVTISPAGGTGTVTISAQAEIGGDIAGTSLSSSGGVSGELGIFTTLSSTGRVDGTNIATVESKVEGLYSYLINNFDTNQLTTATSLTDFVDNYSKVGLDPGDVITLSATNTAYILGDNDGSSNSDWLEVNLKPNFLFYRGNMSDYATLDCVALSAAKSSKYIIQVEDTTDGAIFYGEINVVSDGTIAVATEYALNHTTVFPFVEFGAEVISGRVCLSAVALESKNMTNFVFKGNRSNLFG